MTKYPMTIQGARALEEELKHLKTVMRPKITADIATARELGDLKENAEYHAAREQQGMSEARIRDIEGRLSGAQIIDVTTIPYTGKVFFGTTVEIANVETDETVTYQIVGEDEADLKQGKISVTSPIARALVGKEEGEVVVVQTPGGLMEFEIILRSFKAGANTWQLAQVFWVGGIWMMHFVLLKVLEKLGFASLLVQEVAQYARPLLVGLALVCVLLQLLVLKQTMPFKQMLKDSRGQLLLAALILSSSFFMSREFWPAAQYWLVYSYLAVGMCGLLLVLQPIPGRQTQQ